MYVKYDETGYNYYILIFLCKNYDCVQKHEAKTLLRQIGEISFSGGYSYIAWPTHEVSRMSLDHDDSQNLLFCYNM